MAEANAITYRFLPHHYHFSLYITIPLNGRKVGYSQQITKQNK